MNDTKGPEPWVVYMVGRDDLMPHPKTGDAYTQVYLAAPVEAWVKEIKAVFHALQEHDGDLSMNEYWENQARRLLANWPIKE